MPLCDALTTEPNHSPSGRVNASPGVQPDPDGPSGWVVDGGVPVVTTVVVEVVDEIDGTVVEVARDVTVTIGAVVSDTPLDPVQAATKRNDITPAASRRLTGSVDLGEEVDYGLECRPPSGRAMSERSESANTL
jgi:hypothetical protein